MAQRAQRKSDKCIESFVSFVKNLRALVVGLFGRVSLYLHKTRLGQMKQVLLQSATAGNPLVKMESRPPSTETSGLPEEATLGVSCGTYEPPYIKVASQPGERDSAPLDYTARVIPRRDGVAIPLEIGQILWQRGSHFEREISNR